LAKQISSTTSNDRTRHHWPDETEQEEERETIHKQVLIGWRGRYAEVDEELAPLIQAIWRAGIDTINSCQENQPGIAWIEFATARDAQRFLNLVAECPDKSELHVVNGRLFVGDTPFEHTLYPRVTHRGVDGGWRYDVSLYDLGVDEEIVNGQVVDTPIGPSDFQFAVSIRFPRTELPLLLEKLQERARPCRTKT
jgi:hypothetical protein